MKFRYKVGEDILYASTNREIASMFLLLDVNGCSEPALYTGFKDMHGVEIYYGDVVIRKRVKSDYWPYNCSCKEVKMWIEGEVALGSRYTAW